MEFIIKLNHDDGLDAKIWYRFRFRAGEPNPACRCSSPVSLKVQFFRPFLGGVTGTQARNLPKTRTRLGFELIGSVEERYTSLIELVVSET